MLKPDRDRQASSLLLRLRLFSACTLRRKKKEDGIVEEGLEFADDSYINEDEENAENQQK